LRKPPESTITEKEKPMDYDDISPRQVYRETGRWIGPAIVVSLAVVVVGLIVTLVCWQAGWWFASRDATRQAEITQNGYSNQTTLRQQVTSKLAEVTGITSQIDGPGVTGQQAADLKAQRMAIASAACGDAAQVTGTPLPGQQAQWVSVNCSAGSVSPSSSLYVTGAP
jgi:hypothetical protein